MFLQKSGIRIKLLSGAFSILLLLLADVSRTQTPPNIVTWGTNQSPWGQQLGILAAREGCSESPAICAASMDAMSKSQGVSKIYLSIPFTLANSVSHALQYSKLSLTHREIVEIGFDNFVAQIENLQIAGELANPGTFIDQVISATKSANPGLAFGVTLYADQLTHAALQNSVVPATVRSRINFVHLYVRYRQDGANFASHLSQTKALFPNAKIIAGAYPYDRIDYLPCQSSAKTRCTPAQEESLYQQLLQAQANLLKQDSIAGLEFFFGYFGDPRSWADWTQTSVCSTARLLKCYANTEAMQSTSRNVLHATFPPLVSLDHTALFMGSEFLKKLSNPGSLVLTNTGAGPLTIASIGVTGANSIEFPLKHNCPQVLAPSAKCTLNIYFDPIALGTRAAQILIDDDAGTGSQTVNLTGTGISSSTSPTFLLSSDASRVSFGTITVGSTSSKTVSVSNTGTSSVTISGVAVSGVGVSVKGLTAKTVLGAGQAATLHITYAPTAVGTTTGSLVVVSTATNSPVVISITGAATSSSGTPHSVTINWTKSTSTVAGYRVYRSTTSGGPYTLLTRTLLPSTAVSYVDSAVVSNKTYYYVLSSVNSAKAESSYSSQVTATIP